MTTQFFMAMKPPTTTQQQKRIGKSKSGKLFFYDSDDLKSARAKITSHLSRHIPDKKYNGPIRLMVKWCFPITAKHYDGEYKTTKPDTDNLQKMIKDIMTKLNYWDDDALVCSEIIEKFYADKPGIFICIQELHNGTV